MSDNEIQDIHWMGIDFGTCRSSASVLIGGEPQIVNLGHGVSYDMPTAIFLKPDGTFDIGEDALNARVRDYSRFLGRFKLRLGRSAGFTTDERTYQWQEIVAPILSKIKVQAERQFNQGEPLTRVILTVPALYIEGGPQWIVMEEAARLAGFQEVHLVREPSAAATYYDHVLRKSATRSGQAAMAETKQDEITLVYDLGGGTFDPALIQRKRDTYTILDALPEGEAVRCGGIYFDEKILADLKAKCPDAFAETDVIQRAVDGSVSAADVVAARRQAKRRIDIEEFVIRMKHRFSNLDMDEVIEAEPVTFSDYHLTRKEFYSLIEPLLDSTMDCCRTLMQRSEVDWKSVGRILMIGGSCNIPLVRTKLEALAREAGAAPEICWLRIGKSEDLVDPVMAVCLGASLSLDTLNLRLMGEAYEWGHGVECNLTRAIQWYEMAARAGDSESNYRLGIFSEMGKGVPLDEKSAMKWYLQAGDLGHTEAAYSVARLADERLKRIKFIQARMEKALTDKELEKARFYSEEESKERAYLELASRDGAARSDEAVVAGAFAVAAELGNAEAQFRLAECYSLGRGIEQDDAKAAGWFGKAAEADHAEAQYRTGKAYEEGVGVLTDEEQAMRWYLRAGAKGHALAQSEIGAIYYKKDQHERAIEWLSKAAEQNMSKAQYCLALMYDSGLGVPADSSKAVDWLTRAAELGYPKAEYMLGIHFMGDDTEQKKEQGFSWIQKAANHGHTEAHYALGHCYKLGIGVTRDMWKAVASFRAAADKDYAEAHRSLGVCYGCGEGVACDLSVAIKHLKRAIELGSAAAMKDIGQIYAYVPTLKDRKLSKEWLVRAHRAGAEGVASELFQVLLQEALEKCFSQMPDVYYCGAIPENKMAAVREVYGYKMVEDETVVMIYDDTVFGGAKEGFLVTTRGMGCKVYGDFPNYWHFENVDAAALVKMKAAVTTPSAKTVFSQKADEIARIFYDAVHTWPGEVERLLNHVE